MSYEQVEIGGEMVREAVGVFGSIKDLNEAVAELEGTSFPRQDISVLNRSWMERHGKDLAVTDFLADSPDTPRTILIRPEEKVIGSAFFVGGGVYAGGVTAGLFSGGVVLLISGAIAGGLLGAMVAWGLSKYYNRGLEKQIERGGLLLWVRTPGPRREILARGILERHGAQNVHVHEIA